MASDQDGAPQFEPSTSDPEDRQTPGEAAERSTAGDEPIDVSGEMTDALADDGQEAGEDNRALTAEENVLQQTSVEEPGKPQVKRPPARSQAPMPSTVFERLDPPSPITRRDTDLTESSGEINDVVQDARQEHRLDDDAQHAEDRAPDG
jgi:hypothetical protein